MEWTNKQLAAWLGTSAPAGPDAPDTPRGWAGLTKASIDAGVAGLLLEHAGCHDVEMPESCINSLRTAAMTVAANNLNLMRELESVVRVFGQANLPVMLLKGAPLNLTVYGRPDLRPMSDIDLLVPSGKTEQAVRLLTSCGCRRGFDLVRDDFFPKYHYEIEFITTSARPVRIDLHARPFRPVRFSRTMPDDALWQGARTVHVGTGEATIPRPEFMFIHLAGHAAFHGCDRLLWLYDIKRFVEKHGESMDWALVSECAWHWRLSLPVLAAMEHTNETFGRACPPEVMGELARHRVTWCDRLVLRQAPRDAVSPVAHVLVGLLCTPGTRFRIGYLLAYLFPGRQHIVHLYPFRHRGWVACAYVWRSIRGLGRVVLSPFHGISQVLGRLTRCWPRARASRPSHV